MKHRNKSGCLNVVSEIRFTRRGVRAISRPTAIINTGEDVSTAVQWDPIGARTGQVIIPNSPCHCYLDQLWLEDRQKSAQNCSRCKNKYDRRYKPVRGRISSMTRSYQIGENRDRKAKTPMVGPLSGSLVWLVEPDQPKSGRQTGSLLRYIAVLMGKLTFSG